MRPGDPFGEVPTVPHMMMAAILLGACSENQLHSKETDPGGTSTAGQPEIRVDPPSVDYGAVPPGVSSAATVTIHNEGEASLHINGLDVAGGTPSVTWTTLSSPVVAPGGAVTTLITWTAEIGVDLQDDFRVSSDDPDEVRVRVPLTGTVYEGDLQVEPRAWDFGDLDVGAAATLTLAVSNIGVAPIEVSDSWYTSNDKDLHVLDMGGLAVLPTTFDPGESTEVVVEYVPSAAGSDEGALQIASNDPDEPLLVANQVGTGLDPCPVGATRPATLDLTADDSWRGWLDGEELSGINQDVWYGEDHFSWDLACGDHTLAVYVTDTAQVTSGLLTVLRINDAVAYVTGPEDWLMTDSLPDYDWREIAYDDSAWKVPEVCADLTPWGSFPTAYYGDGATWIWWTSACNNLGEAWFRLDFEVR